MILKTCCLSLLIAALPFSTVKASEDPLTPPMSEAHEAIPHFAIRSFDVQGNTILSRDAVSLILQPFIGADKNFGDVQQALDSLENSYRDKGYTSVSVSLPEQELKDGVIAIKVVEAKIADIQVEGNSFFSRQNITGSFPSLIKNTSPRIHEISKNLRAVNENPAKKVSLQFQRGGKEDEVIARLKVVDERYWKIGLTLDNTGNKQTGDYRLGLLLQHFNLHDKDHVATVQYTTSPDHVDKVNSISGSYRFPIYSLGDTIDIFAGYSDVDSGSFNVATSSFNYAASNINGKGVVSGVRYNYTLKRFGEYAQKLVAGMDYRYYDNRSDVDISINGTKFPTIASNSKLVLHPVSLTYNGSYTLEQGEAGLYLGGVYNIPWGAYGDRNDFPEGSPADYFALRYGATLAHALPADFQLRFSFTGQYSPHALVTYEQIGLGGASSGRGYEERAAAGDNGYSGTAEVYSPDVARLFSIPHSQLRAVAFYDDGYVFRAKAVQGDDGGMRASSAGGGLRLSISKHFTASVDWGVVLTTLPDAAAGENKIHFKAAFIY